jgi:hypothetical protein
MAIERHGDGENSNELRFSTVLTTISYLLPMWKHTKMEL